MSIFFFLKNVWAFSVCLRCWLFVCVCICVSLGWSMALFMDQLSDEKSQDTVSRALFHNKKYFIIMFLIINIHFLVNKWYLNTPLLVCLYALWFDFLINYYFYFISKSCCGALNTTLSVPLIRLILLIYLIIQFIFIIIYRLIIFVNTIYKSYLIVSTNFHFYIYYF